MSTKELEINNIPLEEKDLFKQYVTDLEQYPLLEDEEHTTLCLLAQKGNKDAFNKMVAHNLRLVIFFVKPYATRGVHIMDLIQQGNMGLFQAIKKFNPKLGKFSTYASHWILHHIRRYTNKHTSLFHIPEHVAQYLNKIQFVRNNLRQELGRDPTDLEVSIEVGISIDKLYLYEDKAKPLVSLSRPLHEACEQETLGDAVIDSDKLNDPVYCTTNKLLKNKVIEILNWLNPRERKIIIMRFGLKDDIPHTLEEVSREFGVSRERIRQLEKVTLKKLQSNPIVQQLFRDMYSTNSHTPISAALTIKNHATFMHNAYQRRTNTSQRRHSTAKKHCLSCA